MLQPIGKRILISAIHPERKPSIIMMKEEAPQTFNVIAVGEDVKKIKVGDIIFIAAFSTSEIKYNDEKYTLVFEDNVIARVA